MERPIHDSYEGINKLSTLLSEDYDDLAEEIARDFHGSANIYPEMYAAGKPQKAAILRDKLKQCVKAVESKNPTLAMELRHINTHLALLVGEYEMKP